MLGCGGLGLLEILVCLFEGGLGVSCDGYYLINRVEFVEFKGKLEGWRAEAYLGQMVRAEGAEGAMGRRGWSCVC